MDGLFRHRWVLAVYGVGTLAWFGAGCGGAVYPQSSKVGSITTKKNSSQREGTDARQTLHAKEQTNRFGWLVPGPVVDDQTFLEDLQEDIRTHPAVKRLKLDIRVIEVENGYVTLALLNGPVHISHDLEHNQKSLSNELQVRSLIEERAQFRGRDAEDILQTLIEVYHADPPGPYNRECIEAIQAVTEVSRVVRRYRKCKGLFWKELPVSHARHLFDRANKRFAGVWSSYLGVSWSEFQEAGAEEAEELVFRALRDPRLVAQWWSAVGSPRRAPEDKAWLADFEGGLSVFPKAEGLWQVVTDAVQRNDKARVLETLQEMVTEFPEGPTYAPLYTAGPRGLCEIFQEIVHARAAENP